MKKIKALVEKKGEKMIAIASDSSNDRQGDSIKQDNWDLRNFRKNPVLLLSHQHHLPPVGVAKNIRIDGKKMTFEPVFHDITQQAREVKQMYIDGIMKAFSVGFMDSEKKNELLEISAVSVPANANALVFSKSFTEKDEIEIKSWVEKKKKKKSPACRMENETEDKCIARKIPEIRDENPEMENEQVAAIAYDVCSKPCVGAGEQSVDKPKKKDTVLSAIKDINIRLNNINKGRPSEDVISKALEKLNKQLGYLQRKLKK